MHMWLQVSTILQGMPCDMLPNPMAEHGWEADPEALEEVRDAVQQALDMPTQGRPLVVTFCTDGSRSAVVRPSSCGTPSVVPFSDTCRWYLLCGALLCITKAHDVHLHKLHAAPMCSTAPLLAWGPCSDHKLARLCHGRPFACSTSLKSRLALH
jgi:hypothetical protein